MSAVKYMTESDDVRPRQSPPTRVRTRPELASDVAMNTASRAWVDTGTHFYPHTDAFSDNSPGSFSCLRKWSKIIHYPLSITPTAVYTFIFFSAEKVESLLKSLGTHTDMGERVHNECWIPA